MFDYCVSHAPYQILRGDKYEQMQSLVIYNHLTFSPFN